MTRDLPGVDLRAALAQQVQALEGCGISSGLVSLKW